MFAYVLYMNEAVWDLLRFCINYKYMLNFENVGKIRTTHEQILTIYFHK